MPRTSFENQRVRDERREQILLAARRVFARKGFAAAKIADIGEAVGISHGLVYHYFESKDEIFVVIVEQALQGALWLTTAARQQPGTPWDHIIWLLDATFQGARENPDFLLITIQASTSEAVPDGARELMARQSSLIFRNVVGLIEEAQTNGQAVKGDASKLATALTACIQGLVLMIEAGDREDSTFPEPEMILRMLKA